jgi:hypothetical protein
MPSGAEQVPSQDSENSANLHACNWQFGVFAQGGFPPAYKLYIPDSSVYVRADLDFYSLGVEAGRQTRRAHGPGPLRGRGEAMLELMPYWLARYPAQSGVYEIHGKPIYPNIYGKLDEQSFHGASVTPFLLRWNFAGERSRHLVPWAQLGGGLLWTNHKFPIGGSGTSVINFTPQVGAGVNIFRRPNQSLDFALKAIHISNASLGDQNPGLNQTLQFSAGYSWWK